MDKNEKENNELWMESLYKYKQQLEKSYRELITDLKILCIRAEYMNKKEDAKRYKDAYRKLERIQEESHLTEIGKDGVHKEIYKTALKVIEERYGESDKTKEALEDTVSAIEELCEKFDVKDENEKDEKTENTGIDR